MDGEEQEKPFPIEYFVILLLVAIANDVAEIIFDLLDFTGIGIAGEAIMEPANFILDIFFTGVFFWKVGFGGSTITQYFGDLLEPLLIPGRTISVWIGMYTANNPGSFLGKYFAQAASIESGNIEGAVDEAKGAAGAAEKESGNVKGGTQEAAKGGGEKNGETDTTGGNSSQTGEGAPGAEGAKGNEVFENPLANPVGTAEKEEFDPKVDSVSEGKGFASEEPQGEDEELPLAA
jgi:hypothetical protein